MFNVGGPEILVIFLVALIVLGPQQLPKAMRTFGSVMAEVRKVSSSFQAEMRNAMDTMVDTTATEKPQSGTMATAHATPSTPASPTDSDAIEVVARNVDGAAGEATAAPSGPDAATPVTPAIDPADRAAG